MDASQSPNGDGRPDPDAAGTAAEFVDALRRLKAWTGMGFRRLERRAAAFGRVLPRSTVAAVLRRDTLPSEGFVVAFVWTCGGDQDGVKRWVAARRRIAAGRPSLAVQSVLGGSALGSMPGPVRCILPADQAVFVGGRKEFEQIVTAVTDAAWAGGVIAISGPLPRVGPPAGPLRAGVDEFGNVRVSVGPVPAVADCFQARPDLQRYLRGEPGAVVLSQVFSGAGGVGKTQLAALLAHSVWDEQAVDLRVWIAAGSVEAIVDGYARAAAAVGVAVQEAAQAAQHLVQWLTVTDRPWLVVLDDVTDPAHLHGWIPRSHIGRVIVTTRRADAALASVGMIVPVGLFTAAEAHSYVAAKLASYSHLADDVDGLVQDLGRLPIALAQAAVFMADEQRTCSEYRALFADRRSKLSRLVPRPGRLPDGQQATVDVTWSLSVEAADREEPVGLAGRLLTLACVLDPEGIPAEVLTSPPALTWLGAGKGSAAVSAEQVRASCVTLHRYNLASHNPHHRARALRVHALIQRATHDHTAEPALDIATTAAAAGLHAAWPVADSDTELAQALRANTTTLATTRSDPLWTGTGIHPVLFRAGRSLGDTGQVGAAVTYFAQLHQQAHQRLGPDHPDTMTARCELAEWQGEAGNASEAADALEQLLADRLRVLGSDHPDTLTTRSDLAAWRGTSGDAHETIAAFEQLLADYLRVFGPDHPGTLTIRGHLAAWRGRAGDASQAAAALEPLVTDMQRVLGPDHPETLSTRGRMAAWQGVAGDTAEAAAASARLFIDVLRALGPDHPRTLAIRYNLIRWQAMTGDANAAATAFEQLLTDVQRVLGPDHRGTLATRRDLTHWQNRTPNTADPPPTP